MSIHQIESLMANISEILMYPVLLLIVALFAYALFSLGQFFSLYMIRKRNEAPYKKAIKNGVTRLALGYPLHNFFVQNTHATEDELEVYALKNLENLRIVTRVAPMLGLIATMIPMGPALRSLADGNVQAVTVKVSVAFEFFYAAFFIPSASFLCSGFKVTSVILFQFRVWPLQRSGLAVRAA